MPRNVPESVLDTILGKSTVKMPSATMKKDGTPRAPHDMQKKTLVKQTRASGGNVNPRGGRYKSEDVRHQLQGGVGSHPQEGKTSRERDMYNENVVKAEKRRDFPNEQAYPRLAQQTIEQIGRDKFYAMPFAQAAEILGIGGGVNEAAYQALAPNQKGNFWLKSVRDGKAAAVDAAALATTPVESRSDPALVPSTESVADEILKKMLDGQ